MSVNFIWSATLSFSRLYLRRPATVHPLLF